MRSFNRLDENELRMLYELVVSAARGLGTGSLPFLETVRQLVSLRAVETGADHDPDFQLFVAIDSETDHLPSTSARDASSKARLEECDAEAKEVESHYSAAIVEACMRLEERYTKLLARI
jgi:hypothetical protein